MEQETKQKRARDLEEGDHVKRSKGDYLKVKTIKEGIRLGYVFIEYHNTDVCTDMNGALNVTVITKD